MKLIKNSPTLRFTKGAALAVAVAVALVPTAQAAIAYSITNVLGWSNSDSLLNGSNIDITDAALDLKAATGSVIGATIPATPDPFGLGWASDTRQYSGIQGYIQAGLWRDYLANSTFWTGIGLYSSTAAADNNGGPFVLAVGAADNAVFGVGSPLYGTDSALGYPNFLNLTPSQLADTDVLTRLTYYGDADLNGFVDGTDFSFITNGFNSVLTDWVNGDFNYDGVIDGTDFTYITLGFNGQGAPLGNGNFVGGGKLGGGVVPEPGSALLALVGGLGILSRRRRQF